MIVRLGAERFHANFVFCPVFHSFTTYYKSSPVRKPA